MRWNTIILMTNSIALGDSPPLYVIENDTKTLQSWGTQDVFPNTFINWFSYKKGCKHSTLKRLVSDLRLICQTVFYR